MTWKSEGLSDESINTCPPPLSIASLNSLSPTSDYSNFHKFRIEFNESPLKIVVLPFTTEKIVIFYIVFEINLP